MQEGRDRSRRQFLIFNCPNAHGSVFQTTSSLRADRHCLVTSTARLGDDALHLLDLALGAGEGSELQYKLAYYPMGREREW